MTLEGAIKRLNKICWGGVKRINRIRYNALVGERSGISVLSCNCIGGVVMSELNMKFLTPTVNMFFVLKIF